MTTEQFISFLEQYGEMAIVIVFAVVAIPYYLGVLKKAKTMSPGQGAKAVLWGRPIFLGFILLVIVAALIWGLNAFLATVTYSG